MISLLLNVFCVASILTNEPTEIVIDNTKIIEQVIDKTVTIEGKEGDEGDRGKTGDDGDDGIDGTNGIQGVQGIQGIQGISGECINDEIGEEIVQCFIDYGYASYGDVRDCAISISI